MKGGAALENLTAAIVESCRSGLPPEALRDRVLTRLRRVVPFDAAFWAAVDPTTLLFSQPHQEQIPPETVPYFIQNEFIDADVNKWTTLARERLGVRTLSQATGGDMDASPRYRDLFRPLGFGDELRAVLRVGGACWGYMCLHRGGDALLERGSRLCPSPRAAPRRGDPGGHSGREHRARGRRGCTWTGGGGAGRLTAFDDRGRRALAR